MPLLSEEQRTQLTTSDRLDIGRYRSIGSKRKDYEFVVALDAQPLLTLFDAASYGSRLYELMSITGPSDVLHSSSHPTATEATHAEADLPSVPPVNSTIAKSEQQAIDRLLTN